MLFILQSSHVLPKPGITVYFLEFTGKYWPAYILTYHNIYRQINIYGFKEKAIKEFSK